MTNILQRPEGTPNLEISHGLHKALGSAARLHSSPSCLVALPGWNLQSLVTPWIHKDQGLLASLGDPMPDEGSGGAAVIPQLLLETALGARNSTRAA